MALVYQLHILFGSLVSRTPGELDIRFLLQCHPYSRSAQALGQAGIEVSLFIDPDPEQIEATARTGSPFIELHTGAFAEAYADKAGRAAEIERLAKAAEQAKALGIGVNAGHGINYENVRAMFALPHLNELNIGHSIISRSIETGLTKAVKEMLRLMKGYRGG